MTNKSEDFSFDAETNFGFPSFFKKGKDGDDIYNILNLNLSPVVLVIFLVILILFYFIFSTFTSSNTNSAQGFGILFLVIWCIFIVLLFGNALKYLFDFNVKAIMKDLLKPLPKLDLNISSDSKINTNNNDDCESDNDKEDKKGKEVYNIPRNIYTYENAKAICKAFDSRLASISELQEAYKNGAEWCNYGWSKDQMALFPTQMKSWKKLRKVKGHENDCGRPGVNGGYIGNPKAKFGVNCFGKKPKITNVEKELMKVGNTIPKTIKEKNFNKKVKYYKSRLPSMLISPYNDKKWSKI